MSGSEESLKSDEQGQKNLRALPQPVFAGGFYGRKIGMTSIFAENGAVVPVTAIDVTPSVVVGVKSRATDGYEALRLGLVGQKPGRLSRSKRGQFEKAAKGAFHFIRESRVDTATQLQAGDELAPASLLTDVMLVDIRGVSGGRGFSGVVRRFKVKGQPATRGTHEYRRHIGAVGCRKFPGRIFKNKKMPGRMGGERVSVLGLRIVRLDSEQNILFVKGAVPGAAGGLLYIRPSLR